MNNDKLAIEELQRDMAELRSQISDLKSTSIQSNSHGKTGLSDDRFLKRSFAVLGHSLISQAIVLAPIAVVLLALYLLGIIW